VRGLFTRAIRLTVCAGFVSFGACTLTVDTDYLKNRQCPSGTKLCNDRCVSRNDPSTGCASDSCVPCSLGHATANCANNGLCAIAGCLGNYQDCNHIAQDGCEVDIDHDPVHCGSCNAPACVTANGTPDCGAGHCATGACKAGFDDCNDDPEDGCEVNLRQDRLNCSKCNTPCPPGQNCVTGQCS
jgi:hypothetical protein